MSWSSAEEKKPICEAGVFCRHGVGENLLGRTLHKGGNMKSSRFVLSIGFSVLSLMAGARSANADVDTTLPAPQTAYGDSDALAAAAKYDMGCNVGQTPTVERISNSFRYSYETPQDPIHTQEYFIVTCQAGAYNANSVLLRISPYDTELRAISFAAPQINNKGKLVGFTADVVTGYLAYDTKTETLTSFSKGRGIGDLYVSGTYQLFETDVILREYTIDNVPGDDQVVPPIFKSKEPITR